MMKEPNEFEALALSYLLSGRVDQAVENAIEANRIRARALQEANIRLAAHMQQYAKGFEQ
jgi:hypothetical protein